VFEVSIRLEFKCTNNQVEYKGLLVGLEELVGMGKHVEVFRNLKLIVQQVCGESQCLDGVLNSYREQCMHWIRKFDTFGIQHVHRKHNEAANRLAQEASGYNVTRGKFSMKKEPTSCCATDASIGGGESARSNAWGDAVCEDWRCVIKEYIQNPIHVADRKVRCQALKYTLLGEDLYQRTIDGLLLKCLDEEQAKVAMGKVHEGMCGTHQSAHKMKGVIKRVGFYWPTVRGDYFKYFRGCEACQRFWDIQAAPASVLHPIIKPWPFLGWGLYFISEIHPVSSKGHRYVLAATDCFIKWAEAVPLRSMTHKEVIHFVSEHIMHIFELPQMLTTNQGSAFISHQFKEYAASLKIKLLSSSPYYAQANGQTESSNKILIRLIKKKIEDNPRRWHEVLLEALWAHRVSRHGATKVTPFELVFGQEAVLPIEVNLQGPRVASQDDLSPETYHRLMMDQLDEVHEGRFGALREIEKKKLRSSKTYNRKVGEKSFQVGDLIWKMILPVGSQDQRFGKWSLSWEGPFRVSRIVPGNLYFVETLEGKELLRALNGRYLKKYFSSVWQEA
jgi:ribonuclease HI